MSRTPVIFTIEAAGLRQQNDELAQELRAAQVTVTALVLAASGTLVVPRDVIAGAHSAEIAWSHEHDKTTYWAHLK